MAACSTRRANQSARLSFNGSNSLEKSPISNIKFATRSFRDSPAKRAVEYRADFVYKNKSRELVVEDARGVRTTSSAEQAVEMIAEWQPHLTILDVGLPKTNGIDLAIALKSSHLPCSPVLWAAEHDRATR